MARATTPNDIDASEFVSPWIKKEELRSGSKNFAIENVSETTFEARGDRPSQRVLVLELTDNRRYALSTKADLNLMIDTFGPKTGPWVGHQVTVYLDKGVMFGSDRVGGTRIRVPSPDTADNRATDIDDAMPTAV